MKEQEEIKPKLEDLFEDFLHPNPNINESAFVNMARYWPDDSLIRLIDNIQKDNTNIRRKSIKALGCFGELAYDALIELFLKTKSTLVQTSCVKVLVKISASKGFASFPDKVMNIIELAIDKDSPEMILTVVPLLRQIGSQGLPYLLNICNFKDDNLLRLSTAIIALGEVKDYRAQECLRTIIEDPQRDLFIREGAIRALNN